MILHEAWQRYSAASRQCRRLLIQTRADRLADPDSSLARARREEAEALAQYLEVLRGVAGLEAEGELPGIGKRVAFNRSC